MGSVATGALTEDSVEMEFLTDDPVAQAVRLACGCGALPELGLRPVHRESRDHISV